MPMGSPVALLVELRSERASPGGVHMSFVYVLVSVKDGNRYIGSTNNLQRRLKDHFGGKVKSTKNRRPLILKYLQEFETLVEARIWESKYKKSRGTYERKIKLGELKLFSSGV